MSDDHTIYPGDGDVLAAEHVLGVLAAAERCSVERRLAREPALASKVAYWEELLSALTDAVAPQPPPIDAWSRIEMDVATEIVVSAATARPSL